MDMAKCARKTVNATVPDRPNAANLDYNVRDYLLNQTIPLNALCRSTLPLSEIARGRTGDARSLNRTTSTSSLAEFLPLETADTRPSKHLDTGQAFILLILRFSTEAVEKYWGPIVEWANVGDSVPYVNFNDWLHYGPQLPTF